MVILNICSSDLGGIGVKPGLPSINCAVKLKKRWKLLMKDRQRGQQTIFQGDGSAATIIGKRVKRPVAQNRLRCALHHWTAIAVPHDTVSQAKDQALRSVADRLLAVACAMLGPKPCSTPHGPDTITPREDPETTPMTT
ncbi:MAG: hypothetical protein OXE84_14635 [Rhodobacteraceae bacterium]|nr:hypothetical protein [Paracoccaceae bacterium]MCY4196690.1 hypothetical protein [Paracoccaceae bacterium]MCY4325996.1 hypothetical protein [Paracoccaceae bacterium]